MLNQTAVLHNVLLLFKHFGVVKYDQASGKGDWSLVNRIRIIAYIRDEYGLTLSEAVQYVDTMFDICVTVDQGASFFYERHRPL